MKKFTIAAATGAAVLLAALSPVSAAFAADQTVTGVVTVDGVPLAATEVGWFDPNTGVTGATTTDAAGAYSLTVADGHPYVLYAGANHTAKGSWVSKGGTDFVPVFQGVTTTDYLYQGLDLYPAPTTALTAQNIDLDKPGTVTGSIPGYVGHTVTADNLDGETIARAKTDAAGNYSIAGLIPGQYEISVPSGTKYVPWSSDPIRVAANTTTTVNPVLTPTSVVTGVVKSGGKPVKGVNVEAYNSRAASGDTTDSKGRYTITGLTKGTYTVFFNGGPSGGYAAQNSLVQKTLTKVKVAATSTKKINASLAKGGTVTALVSGTKSADSFSIVLSTGSGKKVLQSNSAPSKDGKKTLLKLTGVKPGTYIATITDSPHKYYAKKKITVTAGERTAIGAVSVSKKTLTLSGKVTGSSKATVYFSSDPNFGYLAGNVKNGKYTVRGIVPGQGGTLSVASPTNVAKEYAITISTSTKKNVKTGAKWGTITGTVLVDGHPKAKGGGQLFDGTITKTSASVYFDGEFLSTFTIKNGVVDEGSIPGTGNLYFGSYANKEFLTKAPYFLTAPDANAKVTVKSGKTTDFGTIELVINGK
jgi:hypothetical protein